MGEVFKLKGILEEIKTTQLKRIEEDIEELKLQDHHDGDESADNNQDIEDLRRENGVIRQENKEMKAEVEFLAKEIERIKVHILLHIVSL